MFRLRGSVSLKLLVCVFLLALLAVCPTGALAQSGAAPTISKIDPPNWWASLPEPMLLVRGENLGTATFSVEGTDVSIKKTKVSGNGHWAFIWLSSAKAKPQTIQILARTNQGTTKAPYRLAARTKDTSQPRGIALSDVLYLIMPDRFARGSATPNEEIAKERAKPKGWHGGDLKGIEQHLDYIQQLGVTAIWLTPVYDNSPIPDSYHGYGATDVFAVDPHFGTMADYKALAAALHKRGMKLVFDTVPNHMGASHPWVADPPTPDWFHGTAASHRPPNYEFDRLVDPYATRLDRRDVIQGWFANVLPDMNTENPLVSEYLIQNTIWWIESAGIDALRLDTFPYVGRTFWRDFHSRVHAVYPTLTTFGETFNFDPRITSYFIGGPTREGINTGVDSLLDYPLAGAIRAVVQNDAPMTKIREVLSQDWLYPHPERLITFIGNHDNNRVLNTDSADPVKLKFGLGLLATIRGIPQFYVGDEIAMRGGDDPDNRRDFPGGFPGDKRSAFDAAGRTPQEQDMHEYVVDLMKYRNLHSLLRRGQQENLYVDDSAYLFARVSDRAQRCTVGNSDERLLVAANKSAQARDVTLELDQSALQGCSSFEPSFGSGEAAAVNGGKVTFHLAPQSVVVYRVR